MVVNGHPITIASPGVTFAAGSAASSTAIPNSKAGIKAKWVMVSPLDTDHSFQFIVTGGDDVVANTGIRLALQGGPQLFNVTGMDLISFRNASGGGVVTDAFRVYPLEDQ